LADLAINGQIVGLSEQGQLLSVRTNKVQLNSVLPKTTTPFHLATIESNPRMFVLSGSYLVTSDLALSNQQTSFLATKTSPIDIAINSADNTLWLAVGKSLYVLKPA
jgi:hypothetical protein